MKGDFSSWRYDPTDNDQAVLFQQGRVILDADLTAAERIALDWRSQAGRDVIGAGVAAVPATDPEGFRVLAAAAAAGGVQLDLHPGRIWADGLHLHLPGDPANPTLPVQRLAPYYDPPLSAVPAGPEGIGDGVRDAVILQVALEALNGFQDPPRLIEAALGGPDTAERVTARMSFHMLRLGPGEDCTTILGRLADGPAGKGRLSVSLEPTQVIPGDCPVVEGGGYAGFEHNLYRIEIAHTNAGPPQFKWSQFNGGLVGRGRFHALPTPRVEILANRPAILNSGLDSFYLEALDIDPDLGHWRVIYGAMATVNSNGELDLTNPPTFGAFPNTSDGLFFRLWNDLAPVGSFIDAVNPQPLQDGIRLVFDPPAGAGYRPGDYWIFEVRAGKISNPQVLIDQAPPAGPILRRVPLAEIHWTDAADTAAGGTIEDCRRRFRPLTNQRICCTLLVGDGITTFGDFNSLEEAALHLPASGGELCLLPGLHFANLHLVGQRNIRIHGCPKRTFVLPRLAGAFQPIIRATNCTGIHVSHLDMFAPFAEAVVYEGASERPSIELALEDCRILARTYGLLAHFCEELTVASNQVWLMDLVEGRSALSIRARHALIERNRLGVWPFDIKPPRDDDDTPDDDTDPADPCADPEEMFGILTTVIPFVVAIWTARFVLLPQQPYRAQGGIHLRGGCESVKVLENRINGGAAHGVILGGLLPGELPRPDDTSDSLVSVDVRNNVLHGYLHDEAGNALSSVGVYIRSDTGPVAEYRSDTQGYFRGRLENGSYGLTVDAGFEIVEVRQGSLDNVPFYVIILRQVAVRPDPDHGFLYDIVIQENEIERMALSGIGFMVHDARQITLDLGNPDSLADLVDLIPIIIAPQELVRHTNLVRDLIIRGNRIHHNLRAVFDEPMRALVRSVGLGGITLAMVEQGSIAGNQILDNGTSASNPTCGIFIGYCEDMDIADNVIAGNGPLDQSYTANGLEGLRGGIVVRLASALVVGGASDVLQKPAIHIADNRVDQPAGRALTVNAFGPVSVVGNYLNSEREGRYSLLDTWVGAVLILNLGGVHRQILFADTAVGDDVTNQPNIAGPQSSFLFARANPFFNFPVTETFLPGGETLFNSNQVRFGADNRAFIAQLVITMDDLGFDGDQSSVFRPDVLFANAFCISPTLRVTDNRFRERTRACFFSALTYSFGLTSLARYFAMNTTAHNQGEHCIVALSNAPAGGPPVVDDNNLEVLRTFCRQVAGNPDSAGSYIQQALTAILATQNAAPVAELDTAGLSTSALSNSLNGIHALKTDLQYVHARESARVAGTPAGAGGARAELLSKNSQAIALVSQQAELVTIKEASVPQGGIVIDGRVTDSANTGRQSLNVEVLRADGSSLNLAARTDASGYYSIALDAAQAEELAGQRQVHIRVVDDQGKVLRRTETPLAVQPNTSIRHGVVIDEAQPTQSDILAGKVIFPVRREPVTPTPTDPIRPAPTDPVRPAPTDPVRPTPTRPERPSPLEPVRPTPVRPVTPTPVRPVTPLALESVRGIGPRTAERLRAGGIEDADALVAASPERLREIGGFDVEAVRREAAAAIRRRDEGGGDDNG